MKKWTKTKNKMKRPLFISLLFLIAGIILGRLYSGWHIFSNVPMAIFPVLIFLLLLFIHKLRGAKSYNAYLGLVFFMFFAGGYSGIINSLTPHNAHIHYLAQNNHSTVVHGRVASISTTSTGRERLTFNVNSVYNDGTHIYANFRIHAILRYGEHGQVGQYLALHGNLQVPSLPSFPGGFNQLQFARSRGIQYTMFPRNVSFGEVRPSFVGSLYALQYGLVSVFDAILPPPQAALMQSIILGERSNLDDDTLDDFRTAGLYHILVVSGLHLSVLFIALNKALDTVFPLKISAVITLGFIIIFAIMVGGISVTRASLMACVMVGAKLFYRERDFVTSISFAAVCLLLWRPIFLFDIGFLLSFGAVFGIAFGARPMERVLTLTIFRLPLLRNTLADKWLVNAIAVNLAVYLTLVPVFAYFFFHFRLYDMLSNILVIITGKVLVVLGFVIAIVGLINTHFARILAIPLYYLVRAYESIATFFAHLPNAQIFTGRPSLLVVITYYIALGSVFVYFSKYRPFLKDRRIYRGYVMTSMCAFFIAVSSQYVFGVIGSGGSRLQITYLDVGNGITAVITKENRTFVVDAGGLNVSETGRNTASSILVTYLQYRGIRNISGMFVANECAQHVDNLVLSLRSDGKNIGHVFTTSTVAYRYQLGATVTNISAPATVHIGDFGFYMLYPFASNSVTYSFALRLTYANTSFLFANNMYQRPQQYVLYRFDSTQLVTDVLAVSYTNFRTGAYAPFVDALSPIVAVVSASPFAPSWAPTPEVINILTQRNVPLYNTAINDTIIVTTNGYAINVLTTQP